MTISLNLTNTSVEATTINRRASDSVLFGHMAEVLCNKRLAPVLYEYGSLLKFFNYIVNAYFATPYIAATDDSRDQSWKVIFTPCF